MKNYLRFVILPVIWLSAVCVGAETATEKANNIKRAADRYFFGQSTVADRSQAKLAAENILIAIVSDWLSENYSSKPFSPALASKFQYIEIPKGRSTLVLAYIEQSTVAEYASASDNPAANSRDLSGSIPSEDISTGDIPSPDHMSETVKPHTYSGAIISDAEKAIIDEILAADDLFTAFQLLDKYQTRRKIKNFGDITSGNHPDKYFVIIGTRNQKIETVLSNDSPRYNYRLGIPDRLDNYKGCPMVWFSFY